ncbi:hypothetical protein XELAEV_18022923mg [Xenopus laevis]|uniref:GPI-anchor transamidase n=1 Tax=Xenopus laevis TaxID=8355 RepID=A0A974HNL5_XENLA|nr:hypothetical protein XELAEV_18022923mg [Xenopus laevis]
MSTGMMLKLTIEDMRYNELLFIIDTCQDASMYKQFYSPNIMALASSQVGEDSLSFQVCPKSLCVSTPGHRTDLFQRDPSTVLITDFFGSVRKVELTKETVTCSLKTHIPQTEKRHPPHMVLEPVTYANQLPVLDIIHQKP